MPSTAVAIAILIADDDEDDVLLAREALAENGLAHTLHTVPDGQALLDYLYRRGPYAAPAPAPRPGLILLDLNMPRKDGRHALAEIRADADLRDIPVVILTTSKAEEDIARSYASGANSYIRKPVSFEGLCQVMRALHHYWFEIVELPPGSEFSRL